MPLSSLARLLGGREYIDVNRWLIRSISGCMR